MWDGLVTSIIEAVTSSGNVAKMTRVIFHCNEKPIIAVANNRVKFCTTKEIRSPMAPFTVVASADKRDEICPLLFSSLSNQLISFVKIPDQPIQQTNHPII